VVSGDGHEKARACRSLRFQYWLGVIACVDTSASTGGAASHLDEPLPPALGQYQFEHTRKWAAKIAPLDGFVIVTPEYNHSTSGVLKNAIDYLYAEWHNKAVGFVSYGSVGGARAAEHLRPFHWQPRDG
jgi:NAD(P)H-dependent FMN reductase